MSQIPFRRSTGEAEPGAYIAGVCIAASLFLAFWAAPRYGKTNQFVYIGICSLIGGLSGTHKHPAA